MSTCTSPSAPRSTSSMRCAEKSRRRRFSRPSASPSDAGTRCTAMSHSVCTLSSGASHPASTGWPGRRRSAWPRRHDVADRPRTLGCSYQCSVRVETVSNCGDKVVALERAWRSHRAPRGDRSRARRRRRVPPECCATSAPAPGGCGDSPSSICSVQWRCIAASRSGCGPSPVARRGPRAGAPGRAAASGSAACGTSARTTPRPQPCAPDRAPRCRDRSSRAPPTPGRRARSGRSRMTTDEIGARPADGRGRSQRGQDGHGLRNSLADAAGETAQRDRRGRRTPRAPRGCGCSPR